MQFIKKNKKKIAYAVMAFGVCLILIGIVLWVKDLLWYNNLTLSDLF